MLAHRMQWAALTAILGLSMLAASLVAAPPATAKAKRFQSAVILDRSGFRKGDDENFSYHAQIGYTGPRYKLSANDNAPHPPESGTCAHKRRWHLFVFKVPYRTDPETGNPTGDPTQPGVPSPAARQTAVEVASGVTKSSSRRTVPFNGSRTINKVINNGTDWLDFGVDIPKTGAYVAGEWIIAPATSVLPTVYESLHSYSYVTVDKRVIRKDGQVTAICEPVIGATYVNGYALIPH